MVRFARLAAVVVLLTHRMMLRWPCARRNCHEREPYSAENSAKTAASHHSEFPSQPGLQGGGYSSVLTFCDQAREQL